MKSVQNSMFISKSYLNIKKKSKMNLQYTLFAIQLKLRNWTGFNFQLSSKWHTAVILSFPYSPYRRKWTRKQEC